MNKYNTKFASITIRNNNVQTKNSEKILRVWRDLFKEAPKNSLAIL